MAIQEPESGMDKRPRAAVPPPLIFFGALVIGVVLNLLWPLPIFAKAGIGDVLGLLAALGSGAFAFWAFRTMLRAGENPDPGEPTQSIVTEGPFARTRNPLYLSFAIFDLGVALLLNNLWIALVLVPLVVYIDLRIVRREERKLQRQFGDEYLNYKRSVRRWL